MNKDLKLKLTPEQLEIFTRLQPYSKAALSEWIAIMSEVNFTISIPGMFSLLDELDKCHKVREWQTLLNKYEELRSRVTEKKRERLKNHRPTKRDCLLARDANRISKRMKTLEKQLHP